MIWGRLKNFWCPACKKDLMFSDVSNTVSCTACPFFMSKRAFDEIVNLLYRRHPVEDTDDNLSKLSNL